MQFAGPGKTRSDLELALGNGVCLNVESIDEVAAIAEVARALSVSANVAVRVHPPVGVKGARMRMGGGGQKFGVAVRDLPQMLRRISDEDVLTFRGLHIYSGTQCFDANAWVENAKMLLDIAGDLERQGLGPIQGLNFGGGFGFPVFDGDKTFDLHAAGQGIQKIAADNRPDRRYHIELGRYLTAPAGVYLTRVLYKRASAKRPMSS